MKRTARSSRGRLTAAEIKALREHRLDRDLTYRQLAVGMELGVSKLYELLNTPLVVANERTVFKVRKYLAAIEESKVRVPA